jgi:chitin synthase
MSQPPPLHFPPEYAAQRRPNDVPIPTDRAPPRRQPTRARSQSNAGNLRRAKTLTRPERGVAPAPLINPSVPLLSSGSALPSNQPNKGPADSWDAWRIFSYIVTFWAPPFLLSSIGGLKDKPSRQAWREKVALCFIAIILGGTVGFATMGLDRVLCPENTKIDPNTFAAINSTDTLGTVGIQGSQYNITSANVGQLNWYAVAQAFPGQDVTLNFTRTAADFSLCTGLKFKAATDEPCDNTANKCVLGKLTNATFLSEGIFATGRKIGYDWDHVSAFKYYLVVNGAVLNFESYIRANPKPIAHDEVDSVIRTVLSDQPNTGGKDGTKLFYNRVELQQAVPCLLQRYYAGNIDKISAGCFISRLFLYVSLVVIMGIVVVRFAMACVFNWFLSSRLVASPKNLNRRVISPAVMPEGANVNVDSKNGTAPWAAAAGRGGMKKPLKPGLKTPKSSTALVSSEATAPVISMATIGDELFCVCLVTCYSEGEESIRSTLDSISLTTYSDTRKLLFVVCDGMITGAGEKRSTPDICVSLLEADPRFGNPAPMSYVAVGLGAKRENRAMVYAGHYCTSSLSSKFYLRRNNLVPLQRSRARGLRRLLS